jgi:hypothetical protein
VLSFGHPHTLSGASEHVGNITLSTDQTLS